MQQMNIPTDPRTWTFGIVGIKKKWAVTFGGTEVDEYTSREEALQFILSKDSRGWHDGKTFRKD